MIKGSTQQEDITYINIYTPYIGHQNKANINRLKANINRLKGRN